MTFYHDQHTHLSPRLTPPHHLLCLSSLCVEGLDSCVPSTCVWVVVVNWGRQVAGLDHGTFKQTTTTYEDKPFEVGVLLQDVRGQVLGGRVPDRFVVNW